MSRAACRSAPIVVIGGGLLGIEAACGLAKAGASVTLVHLMDRLMERQLDARAALLLKRAVEAKGIRVLLDVATARFVGMVHRGCRAQGRPRACGRHGRCCGRHQAERRSRPLTPVSRSIAVSSSTIISSPAHPMFSQSVNAPSIAASCYGLVEPANEQARALAERPRRPRCTLSRQR